MRLSIRQPSGETTETAVARRPFVIGRDATCDLALDDPKVSRRHATIEVVAAGRALLRDLDSGNGTWIGDRRVEGAIPVEVGTSFQVGDTVLELVADPLPGPAAAPDGRETSLARRLVVERSLRRTAGLSLAAAVVVVGLVVGLVLTGRLGGGGEPGVEQVVERATAGTVLVVPLIDGDQVGSGTGWVLDAAEGFVVTNHHVAAAGESVRIGVDDELRDARLLATAPCDDLSLLAVDDTADLDGLRLGSQDRLRLGQTVVALGFPANASVVDDLVATRGIVSVVRTEFELEALDVPRYPNVIQTDAAINPGNSGGPLLNLDMELVGVNSAGITLLGDRVIQGQGYAIGVDRVRELLPDLEAGRSIGWMGLGFEFVGDDPSLLRQLGLPDRAGLLVTHAVPGTAAADALGAGTDALSLVLAIDGEPMDGSLPRYCEVAGERGRGDTAVLTLARPGRPVTEDVVVAFE